MNTEKVHYWTKMRDRAARNLAVVSERAEPEDECAVKQRLACVFRHRGSEDMAEAVIEACEWVVAHLELAKHAAVRPDAPVAGVVR